MCFFVQTNHTRKELLFLMFKEINLRNHSSLHKLFYSLASQKRIHTAYKNYLNGNNEAIYYDDPIEPDEL